MHLLSINDVNLRDKRVLIREDLNVPLKEGQITNDKRLQAALPTIRLALSHGAAVILMSHLGRPTEGQPSAEFSLRPVADYLSALLCKPVRFEADWIDGIEVTSGEVVLCENTRFLKGEKSDDAALAQQMAALCDVFVMDAFGTAHRAQASTHGVAKFAPIACAGPLLLSEIKALNQVMQQPQSPVLAVVGGAKVSSKLTILQSLVEQVDILIPGGGIANTLLAAQGYNLGQSLVEKELLSTAQDLLKQAEACRCTIPLPVDVRVASEFSGNAKARICHINEINSDDMVLDIGPETEQRFAQQIQAAKTILWNGPVGVFEFPEFSHGTKALAQAIANNQQAFSLAGGGDTLAAIDTFAITDKLSYISTGGGAFLEFLEGKTLPAIAILTERATESCQA